MKISAISSGKLDHELNCGETAQSGTRSVLLIRTLEHTALYEKQGRYWEVSTDMACVIILPEKSIFRSKNIAEEPCIFEQIHFSGRFSVQLWLAFQNQFGCVVSLPKSSPAEMAYTHLARSHSQQDTLTQGMEAYQFFLSWWQQLAGTWRDFTDPIGAAIKYCESNKRLQTGVSELADMAGVSREHFSRIFREKTGISPAAFLRTRRLQQARELILRTDMPLGEIAIRCGFPSKNRMLQAYSHAFGKIPSRDGAFQTSNP